MKDWRLKDIIFKEFQFVDKKLASFSLILASLSISEIVFVALELLLRLIEPKFNANSRVRRSLYLLREGCVCMFPCVAYCQMKPPTIIVPKSIKENVERPFDVDRPMDQSELTHKLVGLDVVDITCSIDSLLPREEFYIRKDLKVKTFRTHHVIPSQKLKEEYVGLPGNEIDELKISCIEITIYEYLLFS